MRKYSIMILFLAGFSALFLPAQAQTSTWHMIEGGRIRFAFAPSTNNDKNKLIYGVMELELKPGWKTYWSNPGNSGMPPAITLDQPAKTDILFPAPQLLEDGKDWAFGYKEHVLLPFSITALHPESSPQISGSVLIGICNVLCIPETIPFQFTTDETPDLLTRGRIRAALSALPKPAHDKFRIVELTGDNEKLRVLLRHPESAIAPRLFMDGHDMQLGIADVKYHKPSQTLYTVPGVSGKISAGQPISYTAVLDGEAISGKMIIEQRKTRPD